MPVWRPRRHSALPRLLLPERGVGAVGFFGADEAIAVCIDLLELRIGAEELAAGYVAIVVAVHLAEPERAGSPGGQGLSIAKARIQYEPKITGKRVGGTLADP